MLPIPEAAHPPPQTPDPLEKAGVLRPPPRQISGKHPKSPQSPDRHKHNRKSEAHPGAFCQPDHRRPHQRHRQIQSQQRCPQLVQPVPAIHKTGQPTAHLIEKTTQKVSLSSLRSLYSQQWDVGTARDFAANQSKFLQAYSAYVKIAENFNINSGGKRPVRTASGSEYRLLTCILF